jgi:hypothetical protein
MEAVLIVLIVFGSIPALVGIILWINSRNRRAILDTVVETSRNGQALSPEAIQALGMPQKPNRNGDLKAGAILVAVAAGFLVLGWSISTASAGDAAEAFPIMAAVASFPGFIGLVLLAFGLFKKKDDTDA